MHLLQSQSTETRVAIIIISTQAHPSVNLSFYFGHKSEREESKFCSARGSALVPTTSDTVSASEIFLFSRVYEPEEEISHLSLSLPPLFPFITRDSKNKVNLPQWFLDFNCKRNKTTLINGQKKKEMANKKVGNKIFQETLLIDSTHK